jgi:hypothetical protein
MIVTTTEGRNLNYIGKDCRGYIILQPIEKFYEDNLEIWMLRDNDREVELVTIEDEEFEWKCDAIDPSNSLPN